MIALSTLGWLGLNLPLPNESGCGYTRDHGLLRTDGAGMKSLGRFHRPSLDQPSLTR